jgi:catechol 2,3-dioxygenase-like lactoylglutathione lyase family enzyme
MIVRRVVVDHVLLVVRDLEVSRRFYRAALPPLGIEELAVFSDGMSFGAEGMNDFAGFAGRPCTTGAQVAFEAPSREAVHAFHATAPQQGSRQRGASGVWVQYCERCYAVFVWDSDATPSRRCLTALSRWLPSRRSATPRTPPKLRACQCADGP